MFTRIQAEAYLAAMIDGEGWVGEPKGKQNRAIRIANTDPVLIDAIVECCDILGLNYGRYSYKRAPTNWSDGEMVEIRGLASLTIVWQCVPFRATRKRDRLSRTLDSYRPPVDPAELRRLYDTGMTIGEVAAAMGVGPKRIRSAMNTHGIPPRLGKDRAAVVWRVRRERSA